MTSRPTLLWFRQDLRLQDNAALAAAFSRGAPIIPVYVRDDAGEGRWAAGAASRWWLHHSLEALALALAGVGAPLVLARGDSATELSRWRRETGAGAVYWNRRYEPAAAARDGSVERKLRAEGVDARGFGGALLHEPENVQNGEGRPFQVFTAFWRRCLALPVAPPIKCSLSAWPRSSQRPASRSLAELELRPRHDWTTGLAKAWTPGEAGARKQLARFAARAIDAYADARDFPAGAGTSRLSAALHFGEVSPRQVWAAVKARSKESGVFPVNRGAQVFLTELGWREFACHLLHHFPRTPETPLRAPFAAFPWADDPGGTKLEAWRRGRTGYPIVDAGMRELWATGWMHNRVRMIVGSFLVKHLRLPWTAGASWFWDTLVDADLANNTLGWQWVSGCGADAAPYFRIFAPVTQGRKFDPDGNYVRRWVPELATLPTRHLHAPWEAPADVLAQAGVQLGGTYPRPMVDHAAARQAALAAFQQMRIKMDRHVADGSSR